MLNIFFFGLVLSLIVLFNNYRVTIFKDNANAKFNYIKKILVAQNEKIKSLIECRKREKEKKRKGKEKKIDENYK